MSENQENKNGQLSAIRSILFGNNFNEFKELIINLNTRIDNIEMEQNNVNESLKKDMDKMFQKLESKLNELSNNNSEGNKAIEKNIVSLKNELEQNLNTVRSQLSENIKNIEVTAVFKDKMADVFAELAK